MASVRSLLIFALLSTGREAGPHAAARPRNAELDAREAHLAIKVQTHSQVIVNLWDYYGGQPPG